MPDLDGRGDSGPSPTAAEAYLGTHPATPCANRTGTLVWCPDWRAASFGATSLQFDTTGTDPATTAERTPQDGIRARTVLVVSWLWQMVQGTGSVLRQLWPQMGSAAMEAGLSSAAAVGLTGPEAAVAQRPWQRQGQEQQECSGAVYNCSAVACPTGPSASAQGRGAEEADSSYVNGQRLTASHGSTRGGGAARRSGYCHGSPQGLATGAAEGDVGGTGGRHSSVEGQGDAQGDRLSNELPTAAGLFALAQNAVSAGLAKVLGRPHRQPREAARREGYGHGRLRGHGICPRGQDGAGPGTGPAAGGWRGEDGAGRHGHGCRRPRRGTDTHCAEPFTSGTQGPGGWAQESPPRGQGSPRRGSVGGQQGADPAPRQQGVHRDIRRRDGFM
eukprot:s5053_g3.t1